MGKTSKKAKNKKGKGGKDNRANKKASREPATEKAGQPSSQSAANPLAGKVRVDLLMKSVPCSYFFIDAIDSYLKSEVSFSEPNYVLKLSSPLSKALNDDKDSLEEFPNLILQMLKNGIPLHHLSNRVSVLSKALNNRAAEIGLNPSDPLVKNWVDEAIEEFFIQNGIKYPKQLQRRLFANLPMIFDVLLKPAAVMMAVKVRRELLSLPNDKAAEKEEKEDKEGNKDADHKPLPALFVMLTTLGEQKAVAVFAGRCEANWKAYLLGLMPFAYQKADKRHVTDAPLSKSDQLNLVALDAFLSVMVTEREGWPANKRKAPSFLFVFLNILI